MTSLKDTPVQEINRMVMATDNLEVVKAWLDEEMAGAKRRSAMRRIVYRLNVLTRERLLREVDEVARGK